MTFREKKWLNEDIFEEMVFIRPRSHKNDPFGNTMHDYETKGPYLGLPAMYSSYNMALARPLNLYYIFIIIKSNKLIYLLSVPNLSLYTLVFLTIHRHYLFNYLNPKNSYIKMKTLKYQEFLMMNYLRWYDYNW